MDGSIHSKISGEIKNAGVLQNKHRKQHCLRDVVGADCHVTNDVDDSLVVCTIDAL